MKREQWNTLTADELESAAGKLIQLASGGRWAAIIALAEFVRANQGPAEQVLDLVRRFDTPVGQSAAVLAAVPAKLILADLRQRLGIDLETELAAVAAALERRERDGQTT